MRRSRALEQPPTEIEPQFALRAGHSILPEGWAGLATSSRSSVVAAPKGRQAIPFSGRARSSNVFRGDGCRACLSYRRAVRLIAQIRFGQRRRLRAQPPNRSAVDRTRRRATLPIKGCRASSRRTCWPYFAAFDFLVWGWPDQRSSREASRSLPMTGRDRAAQSRLQIVGGIYGSNAATEGI